MTTKPKPNAAASALARKRWAGTTKEQRREAMQAAIDASPRTKKQTPVEVPVDPKPIGPPKDQ